MEVQLQALDENLLKNLSGENRFPEIVVYEHRNFGGFDIRTNLNVSYVGDRMNDKISSFVIISGDWEICLAKDFGQSRKILPPGYYSWVEDYDIPNDKISSFRCVKLTTE